MNQEEQKKRLLQYGAVVVFLILLGIIAYVNHAWRFERRVLPQMLTETAGTDGTVWQTKYAVNYGEIYDKLREIWSRQNQVNRVGDAGEKETMPAGSTVSVQNDREKTDTIFSSVVADDNYIYRLYGKHGLAIVETDTGQLNKVWSRKFKEYLKCVYVQDEVMAVIGSAERTDDGTTISIMKKLYTVVYIYNIKDRYNPVLINTLWQSGWYGNSEWQENHIYVMTTETIPANGRKKDVGVYVPMINGEMLTPNRIWISEKAVEAEYLIVTSLDMTAPSKYTDSKAILTPVSDCYIGENGWYIMNAIRIENELYSDMECTDIYKMTAHSGMIDFLGMTRVPGHMKEGTSVKEQEEGLELHMEVTYFEKVEVTDKLLNHTECYVESTKQEDSLCILDGGLNPSDKVDTEYRNTLAKNSFSNLKYASYTYVYDKNRLLSIGKVRKKEAEKTGLEEYGIKIAMYDISNSENVKELHSVILNEYYYSDALNTNKAMLLDTEEDIFGFAAERTGEVAEEVRTNLVQGKRKSRQKKHGEYMLWTYDAKKGFVNILAVPLRNGEAWGIRGMIRKDMLYIIENGNGNRIESYHIKDRIFVDEIKQYNT